MTTYEQTVELLHPQDGPREFLLCLTTKRTPGTVSSDSIPLTREALTELMKQAQRALKN